MLCEITRSVARGYTHQVHLDGAPIGNLVYSDTKKDDAGYVGYLDDDLDENEPDNPLFLMPEDAARRLCKRWLKQRGRVEQAIEVVEVTSPQGR